MESVSEERKYGRDFLLQLRLHPFSLQKPKTLKNHKVVKDKLYLHQISNSNGPVNCTSSLSNSNKLHLDIKNCRGESPLPECLSRRSCYSPGYKCNGTYPNGKSRSCFIPEYSLRKQSFPAVEDCKLDFPYDNMSCSFGCSQSTPWSKQCCRYAPENWTVSNKFSEKCVTSNVPLSAKSKKKTLAIIDPANGKNILDSICKEEPSKGTADLLKNDTENTETESHLTEKEEQGGRNRSPEFLPEIISKDNRECGDIMPDGVSDDANSCYSATYQNAGDSHQPGSQLSEIAEQPFSVSYVDSLNSDRSQQDFDMKFEDFSLDDLQLWNFLKDNCGSKTAAEPSTPPTDLKLEEHLKLNFKILKDQVLTVQQQQQKMSILQSFLRYKKRQLDESYQNLDDKKLEIANWEFSLTHKARKLQEKEFWLESRRLSLRSKEEKLEEREKELGKNHFEETVTKVLGNDGARHDLPLYGTGHAMSSTKHGQIDHVDEAEGDFQKKASVEATVCENGTDDKQC